MPGAKLRELHLAKDLDELQKLATLPPNNNPKALVKLAGKVYSQAQDKHGDGDEEAAYVLYCKYFELVKVIKKSSEYKKDRDYFDSMINKKTVKATMDKLEEISKSLEKRYEKQNDLQEAKKMMEAQRLRPSPTSTPPPPKTVLINGFIKDSNSPSIVRVHVIEPIRLYALINEKCTPFFLMDTRPQADYKASHIKNPASISVPEEILKPGSTVKAIERNLHIEQRSQWGRRNTVDMLIMFDWVSDDFVDKTPLANLKDAFYKWDMAGGTKYKSSPYILKGGFENFAMHYPTLVTNPHKVRPPTASAKKTPMIDYENLEYPDLDAAFIASPSPRASPASASGNSQPSINGAFASGAITMSNAGMEAVNSPNKPKIPDRKSKPGSSYPNSIDSVSITSGTLDNARLINDSELPSSVRSSTASDIRSSTASELNRGMILEDADDFAPAGQPPVIDRSSKAKILMRSSESRKFIDVLEAEADLVEESLELEKSQKEIEEQWKVLRLKRENSASEEMRHEVMKREEDLLAELERMTIEKDEKDEENERLLIELESMKVKLGAQTKRDEDDRMLQDKNKQKVKEAARLKDDVKRMRQERVRQQKDQEERSRRQDLEEQTRRAAEARLRNQELERALHIREMTPKNILRVPLKTEDGGGGGGLNRSHSSPNIAKMLEDEDCANSIIPTPKFDRTSKPSTEARNRDFAGVWGTGKKGLTGLRNTGNTCYMNSLLQCLSNFTLPSQYFIGEAFRRDLNRSSDTRGEVAIEFAEVIRVLWSGQFRSIAPLDLKRAIGKHNDMFRGNDQQDAHELLMTLMTFLHQDVNEIRIKFKVPEQNNTNIPEMEAAHRSWENEKKADKSFIRETFYGQWRSTLTCPHCSWVSVTYESFFELPLKLPSNSTRCSLKQLIETYLRRDHVPYKCPTCRTERQCWKQFEIVKLPLILTISLGRFYNDGLSRKKQNFVDFDLIDVNLGQYATGCTGQLNRYKDYTLYGVCNHFGSLESGHYTAYCYSQVYGKWHKYDDTEVYEMAASDVKSPAAYILFYSAKN
jgi:ubiquitin carboxyl-terminal hydrolase 8